MRQFVLIVRYVSGEIAMITETPDLLVALEQFRSKLMENSFYGDKGHPLPDIKGVKIIPVMYETKYKKEETTDEQRD